MKNAIEIFTMLYNNEISEEECIAYTKDDDIDTDNWEYVLRDKNGRFNMLDLVDKLLNNEYKFMISNQSSIETILAEQQKQNRISQLEAELKRLKGIE